MRLNPVNSFLTSNINVVPCRNIIIDFRLSSYSKTVSCYQIVTLNIFLCRNITFCIDIVSIDIAFLVYTVFLFRTNGYSFIRRK